MVAVAAITCDGIAVGTITVGEEGEVSTGVGLASPFGAPLLASLGDAGDPFHGGSSAPSSYGDTGSQPAPTHQPHVVEHRQPQEHKPRHIRPGQQHVAPHHEHHHVQTGTYEESHEKTGPTFRPGITPRGKAPIATPPHFTTKDVTESIGKSKEEAPAHLTTKDVKEALGKEKPESTFAKTEKEKPESKFAKQEPKQKAEPKAESTFAKVEKDKPESTFAKVEKEKEESTFSKREKEKPESTFPNVKHGEGGIDRSKFQKEIDEHPELVKKMAWMVKGEVMSHATKEARIAQLETAFNRAQARDDTLASALKSVTEGGPHGRAGPYYAGKHAPGGGTYAPSKEPSDAEVENFKKDILAPVMAGSNLSDTGQGPMTGNASANVAANQIRHGTPHQDWGHQGGDILFQEDKKSALDKLPRLQSGYSSIGTESIGKKPVGVTRLGPGSTPGPGATPNEVHVDSNNNGYKYFDKNPITGNATAGSAGIAPHFPVSKDVNWKMMDAEYLSRLNAAYDAMPDSSKKDFKMISGYRPATIEQAKALGMDPHSSQEDIWRRSNHGRSFAAAPPGRSRHQKGMAGDIASGSGLDWLRANAGKYGLEHLRGNFDHPHIQMNYSDNRKFNTTVPNTTAPKSEPTPTASSDHQKTMLFLHGMESRYNQGGVKKTPAQIEADAQKYAERHGYKLEVVPISGDYRAKQEAEARARIAKGGVDAVYGFSAGGYTANRLQKSFPDLKYIKAGAPGTKDDIEPKGVHHMDIPGYLADQG